MSEVTVAIPADDSEVRFDGLEFVELTVQDTEALSVFLNQLGFAAIAHHRSKEVVLYRQGEINLIVNATPGSAAEAFAQQYGSGICALALRTADATRAYQALLARGAWEVDSQAGAMELNIPAVEAFAATQVYLVDRYGEQLNIYDIDFKALPEADIDAGLLQRLDGLTLQMPETRTAPWRDFYRQLFGFTPDTANTLSLGDGFQLQLQTSAEQAGERIVSIHFRATHPDQIRDQLSARGLHLSTVADSPSGQPQWEVLSPLPDLALRFVIGG